MKTLFIVLGLLSPLLLHAEDKDPYLVKTKNFHVSDFSLKQIELGITAVLYNPYRVKVSVDEILIDVFIHDKKLGTITEAAEVVKIRRESAFDLPLSILVKTGSTVKTFFSEGAKLVLAGKKIGVNFKGYIKIKALGFIPVKVKIDQTEYFTMKDILNAGDEKPDRIDTKNPQLTKP
jgi:LEA14-like dessication related protein